MVLGLFYINFYKGPGNFKDLTNKVSLKLFNKRLFVTEKDRINLKNYVNKALTQGFREDQIRKVLLQKGWTKKQIDIIFKERFK